MDFTVLIAVAMTGLAGALGVVVWRVTDADRRRSAARVAALAGAARLEPTLEGPLIDGQPSGLETRTVERTPPETFEAGSGEVFSTMRESTPLGGALTLAFVVGLLLAGIAATAMLTLSQGEPISAVDAATVAPVELLELDHERHGDTWLIKGAVRNPDTSRSARDLSASASLIDDTGAMVGTAEVRLGRGPLAPGDRSAFTIPVSADTQVQRYRVRFLGRNGEAIPHVDRRPSPADPSPTQ